MRGLRNLLGFCAVVLFSAVLSFAQTGSIAGTVSDSSGAVVQGAEVTVRSAATSESHKATSDASGTYALQGFADFVVTGYNLPPGVYAADWLNPANSCQGTDYCLTGYFVQGVIPSTGSLAGTDLGASVIDLTG